MDIAVQGRPDRRRPRPGRRPGQPRPARPEGPVRLAGQPLPDRLTRPLVRERRTAGGDRLGHRDGPVVEPARSDCSTSQAARGAFGFYTSGQLFLEEYYTLAVIGKAGIGTPTWTATPGCARPPPPRRSRRSFGTRRPARLLHRHRPLRRDRAVGPQRRRDPDRAVDADARPAARAEPAADARASTRAARRWRASADVHLAPRPGTNLALMNALLHEMIAHGLDRPALRRRAHASASSELARDGRAAARPSRAAEICGVPADDIAPGGASSSAPRERLLSTVLQGFYQSHQATAAACQVNNIHLLRGMLGRPGCRRPADERPADRAEHPRDAAPTATCPAFATGTTPQHVARAGRALERRPDARSRTGRRRRTPMQIFRYAEQGSIELLWISATNPAVSLPELARIRAILARTELFVVVQDIFLTETAAAGRRGAAGGRLGREDRHVHQRRPHRAPVREGRRARPARPAATWTSSSTTPGAWTSATTTASR